MEFVALVTLLLVLQYFSFSMFVGAARAKSGIQAPAMTGDPIFERAVRVHLNTLEQLVVVLPAMWISGMYFKPMLAAGLGLVFFLGRLVYRQGYMKDPAKRSTGMIIGFLATLAMIFTGAWGVISQL